MRGPRFRVMGPGEYEQDPKTWAYRIACYEQADGGWKEHDHPDDANGAHTFPARYEDLIALHGQIEAIFEGDTP